MISQKWRLSARQTNHPTNPAQIRGLGTYVCDVELSEDVEVSRQFLFERNGKVAIGYRLADEVSICRDAARPVLVALQLPVLNQVCYLNTQFA